MANTNLQQHWENVYNKQENRENASWYQEDPGIVLEWIDRIIPDKNTSIIDMGGGDSNFVDTLLNKGFKNISVLDISCKALQKSRNRLEEKAMGVNWICQDASRFDPSKTYGLWHDRAAFHFLNTPEERSGYRDALIKAVQPGGWVVLATFSKNGPEKCSGLHITRYSKNELKAFMGKEFELEDAIYHDHSTPNGKIQNFVYTLFRRV